MKRSLFWLIPISMTLMLLAACVAPVMPVMTQAPATHTGGPSPVTLTVSAAADLSYAFGEIGAAFEVETGHKVVFNFGSTGQLAQQIEQGAPVDLFAAANVSFIDDLAQQGLILPDTVQLYARGRITLWTHADSPLQITQVSDLARPEISTHRHRQPRSRALRRRRARGHADSRRVGGGAA